MQNTGKLSRGIRIIRTLICIPLLSLAASEADGASQPLPLQDAYNACAKIYQERPKVLIGHWALVSGTASGKVAGTACFYSTNEKSETEAKYFALQRCWDNKDDFQCTQFGSSDSGLSDEMKTAAGRLQTGGAKSGSRGK